MRVAGEREVRWREKNVIFNTGQTKVFSSVTWSKAPKGASIDWWPSIHTRLELVPFCKGSEPWLFVVMCNTVCTVCRKEENWDKKRGIKSLLQNYFHCKHCDSLKTIFYCVLYLLYLLVPSSSNVAFVLRNFHYF